LSPRRACVFFHSRLRRQSYEASIANTKRWRRWRAIHACARWVFRGACSGLRRYESTWVS